MAAVVCPETIQAERRAHGLSIHIRSFHWVLNYGTVLQMYALYRRTAKLAPAGSGVFLLDHINSHINQRYSLRPSGVCPRVLLTATAALPVNTIVECEKKASLQYLRGIVGG